MLMKHVNSFRAGIIVICGVLFSITLLAIPYKKQSLENKGPYPVNKNGQTYGGKIDGVEEEPDLIAAYGVDGKLGYIKATDVTIDFKTPEEALEWQNSLKGSREIPVYDKEGEKVISKFILQRGTGIDYR